MVVRCGDLLKLPSLKEMTLVAGKDGLDRAVSWPYIVQMNSVCEWLHGGELLFVTGIGIKTDIESLKFLISQSYANNLAGVVLMLGNQYIKEIPPAVTALADYLRVPLFKIPWEAHLVEVTRAIGDYIVRAQSDVAVEQSFLAELLFGQSFDEQLGASRASSFGFDLAGRHVAAVLGVTRTGDAGEPVGGVQMEQLRQDALALLNPEGTEDSKKAIGMVQGDTVVLLLTAGGDDGGRAAAQRLTAVCGTLSEKHTGMLFRCGTGRAGVGASGVRASYDQARRALRAAQRMNTGRACVYYPDLGLFGLLYDLAGEEKAEARCRESIGPLLEYDSVNDADLTHTLEVYFENRFNLSQTAQALYIHRNSLIYRLRRVREVLGRDLDDPLVMLDLMGSIMVYRLLCGEADAKP